MAEGPQTHPCRCGHDRSMYHRDDAKCSVRGCHCVGWEPGLRAPDQAGEEFSEAWSPGIKIPGDRSRFYPTKPPERMP